MNGKIAWFAVFFVILRITTMKRISVIIPCYNTVQYLGRCVESVLAQTEKGLELILVDDGSDDGTGAMCDRFAAEHDNVTALHIPNSGPATAKNRGFEVARGEFVSYIDSDDEIVPEMYERMLALADSEQADIVCCAYRQVDEQGNRSHEGYTGERLGFGREEGLRRLLDKDKIYSQGWTKIFRRAMLSENKVRFIDGLKTEEDFLYNLDAFLQSEKIALDDTPYYIYTHRERSLSREYHQQHTGRFAQNMTMRLERTEALLRKRYPTLALPLTMHCSAYYNLMLGRLAAFDYSRHSHYFRKALHYLRRHPISVLLNHRRAGLSLGGALCALLLPARAYHLYRRGKQV